MTMRSVEFLKTELERQPWWTRMSLPWRLDMWLHRRRLKRVLRLLEIVIADTEAKGQ